MWPFDLFKSKEFEQSKTVLVVDDSDVDRTMAVSALIKAGYNVVEANSGKSGLEMARKHIPDLVLLDFIMPDIKGPQVCEILKEETKTKDIPVIFLTSMDTPYSIIDGFDKGADNYLTKPIRAREIVYQVTLTLRDNDKQASKK